MKIMKKAVSILLTLTMVLTIFTVVPVTVSAASQSVTYVDGNGETQTVTAAILTGAETELSPGWYAVTEDIRFEDMVNLSAPDSAKDINLILCDSATMLLTNEIQGFYSDDSVSLNIYGQSSGSGALKSQGGDFIFLMSPNASLNIFGGELTSSYINADYCTITCAGDINISGGSVEKSELVSYNNLTVSGGSVNVPYLMADQAVRFEGGSVNISNDGIYASSIIFNLRDSDASVKSTGYDGSVSTEWYLTDGSNIYSVGEISDTSALSNKTLKMAGHVHTFSEPTWVWEGYEAATATFVCSECGETVVETATVTDEITKAPTESETGITTYTATVTVNGTAYTDTKTKTTHVGNHTFGTPQWDWNGYESATVTVTCTVDGDSFTADAVISSEVTAEPTLTSEGKRVHTATATVERQTFTDTKEETLPKITRDVSVSYRALNNRDVTVTAQKLYGDETELTDGWYAVTDDLTIDYRPNCTGTVNLILCDGVTFNANKGINVGDGATLTVWGQSEGTGTLNAGNIAYGACIGTSSGMNSVGNVNININGGTYLLTANSSAPAIGCYNNHSGVITVNKGKIRLSDSVSELEVPLIGFTGDIQQAEKTYTVNIKGGDIACKIYDDVAIGCKQGKSCTVNISGGTIDVTLAASAVGIGASAVSECTVNITGGFITVKDSSSWYQSVTGIGSMTYSSDCSINLSWNTLDGCRIYSDDYDGNIVLYKAFQDSFENIIAAGSHSASDLEGKTLTPYCTHSYGEPAWTWNTDSEPFTASASFLCSECGDYQTVTAEVTKTRSLTEYIYTGSATFSGEAYTDECETRTTASMNLTVGGVPVTRDNAADILGDGKVSYDVATNTLTLDNAEIPCVLDNDTAYGINYYDTADAFNIVLIGKNTIVYQDSNSGFFVRLCEDTDAYTITGGGSLSFDMQSASSSNNQYIGICTQKPLTIDNASVNWEYLNQYNTAFGIWLESGASLTLRDHTDVSLYFGYRGFTSDSVPLYSSGSSIDVDETSSLALNATSSAISGSVTLSDSTMNLGASVAKNYLPGDAYSTWNKTTALSTYNAIHIPDNVSTHTITVVNAPNGYESIYPLQHKVGNTVEITASPESGYGFAYMKLKRADDGTETKIYAKEFTMPACDVTVTPVFNPIIEGTEPYLTDDLDYVPGQVRHYEEDGKSYGILDNGCMGAELSTPYWGYFTFQNINSETCRITKYTGSTNGLTELVIPKTYNGRKVTELGSGTAYSPLISYQGNLTVVLNENIVRINRYAFYNTMVMRVTGDTSSLTSIGEEAFRRALNNRALHLNLFYPGNVELGKWSLMCGYVTVYLKHATTLSLNNVQANSITYDFIDDHIYGDDPEPTWTWADDYSSAAASFTCSDERCQHREVIDATVSGAVDGEEHTFTATVTFDGKTYTDTKAVSGHAYGEPVWSWSADHSAASAAFACTKTGCDHSETVAAEVTSDFTGDAGHVFTATAQFNGESYTDTVTFPHTYDDPSWSWSDDLSTASVTLTCTDADCQHQKTLSAAITDTQSENVHRFSAYVMYEGMPYVDMHTFGEPMWVWNEDKSSATATFTCSDTGCEYSRTIDAALTDEVDGELCTITATVTFGSFTYTDTVTVPIGDEENPFVIHNKADWIAFAEKINAGYYTMSYYKLADDFDNSDPITTTVGTSDHPFEGHFDGNGKTLNIALNDTANQGTAPFRYISGADIHDMTVIGSVSGNRHAAGLIGFNGGTSTITDITVNANISATANGEGYIGGVIGHNKTAALTMTNVVYGGTLNNRGNYAGGLFGWSDSSTVTMTDCLFKGSYTGSGSFHPVGCKNASDTVSVTLDRVYYTVDPNFSNSSNILSNDGIRVYTEAPDDRIVGTVRAADGEDYYIPASVSGVESEYDYVITEITPTVTVTAYDGTVLERGIDYTVTYDPATVRTAGDYTVTVTGIGDFAGVYTASFTVTGHNYDDYEWEWSEDLATATLVMKCTDDGCDIESRIPSTVSSKISKGVHVYTAFVFLYGTPYVDSQVGSHTYGDPVWSWSEDYQTATAAFTCTDARCGHAEIVDATVTEAYTAGSTTYTAAVTFEGAEYNDTMTVESRKFFVGHTLSLTGDIRMNYYLNLSDEQAQGAAVDFSWIVNGIEKTHSVTLTAEDKTAHGYIASVPVAVAEMTYDVTATLTVGGEQLASDTYSVRQYADVILSDSFASSYTGTGSRSYENLKTLIQTMLDYGAKAQVQFVRNTDNLANKGIDYTMSNVSVDMITATPSNMRSGLDTYGLEYAGTTIVYLTKTSMRHYYKIVDQEKFDAVKDNITFEGEKVGYTERNGEIFFEHADIASADLDTLCTLKIGDSEYQYSVLDYVRECLSSPNAPYATVQLVMATYWYNQAANAYFGR